MVVIGTMEALNFDKKPEETLVAVAMSGGVDSSTVAALLLKQGYQIIGITLKLFEGSKAEQAIEDAKKIADELNFKHYIFDCSEAFKKSVIDNFVNSYSSGKTPLPCAHCNKHIKFGELVDFAKKLGADCLATGHYVQRLYNSDEKKFGLYKGNDPEKDQSYFLFALNQEQIDYARFPLGAWTKEETRAEAEALGLKIAKKPDSQDICFVPDDDYAAIVKEHNPAIDKSGDIIHIDGRVIGKHKGIIHYTVGQRRGLGIGGGVTENNSPLFVIDIDDENNRLIVGDYKDLAKNKIYIKDTNWLIDIDEKGIRAEVKLRSIQKLKSATIFKNYVLLDEDSFGVAKDQACVAYIGNRLIGGGYIVKAEKT